ncbi:hypothetical protein ScPMuIL_011838 [Solemya velum]
MGDAMSGGHYKRYGDSGMTELANLVPDLGPHPPFPPMGVPSADPRKSDTPEVMNLTLHQCARNGDIVSTEILLKNMGHALRKKINYKDEDLLTPLHYAARNNHLGVVQLLMEHGANPNSLDEEGLTPLHFAARYKRERQKQKLESASADEAESQTGLNGLPTSDTTEDLQMQDEVVVYLISHGCKINMPDIYGQTPLHYAAMRGNEIAAKTLLGNGSINIEIEDKQRMTALHMAASHNQVVIAQMLIEAGANLRCCTDEDSTPLHLASSEGNIEIVRMLFEAGAKRDGWVTISNMVTDRDCEQSTCLHLAVENGHFDVVSLCLEKRADVNTPSSHYMNPLHLAAVAGDVRIVRLLVEHNARIDALNDEQNTPLHKACQYNHVPVVEYLVDRGAQIDRRDKDNFTPLLLASVYGHAETVELLLKKGADYSATDKNDKTAIFLAAEEDKYDALEKLLSYGNVQKLIDRSDRYDNNPLHIAATNGFLRIVKLLLKKGADLDSKNEEEHTPLHLAARYGRTNTVREIVHQGDKSVVNDEDENSNTALHLSALYGHAKVASVLIAEGADVAARNQSLWTPLDCAAAKGWAKTAEVLLNSDAPIDPMDKTKTTPLHLACRYGHATVVELLLKWNANVSQRDSDGNNCLDLAIDNSSVEVVNVIIASDVWQEALRNETMDIITGRRNTPMRKLIKRMPDSAEKVFTKCMTDNKKMQEHQDYQITFNYEFLDDLYSNWTEQGASDSGSGSGSVYDEDYNLVEDAKPYTNDSGEMKKNHPLMIMVTSKREDLLAHPLVTFLLRHKWKSYGRLFYYINFLIYAVFLVFLTAYVVTTEPPWMVTQSLQALGVNESYCVNSIPHFEQDLVASIGKYVIIALAAWNLLRELLQIYQAKLNYMGWENLIEWVTYITALLLVIDFEDCQRISGYRQEWQWYMGSVAIFLSWIDLVLFIQKFPRFGIYVVMFKDILTTFLQFFIVFFLFIVAFSLGFFTLLQNQVPFDKVWKSLMKTSVMMIGEFEFDSIFNDRTNNMVYYEAITYVLFVIFMIIMSIIIMNLLVGLAVDDIKAVQEQAALKRMAMQVDLALDVERVLPGFIRRRFVIKCEKVKPNAGIHNPLRRIMSIDSDTFSSLEIAKALNPELDEIEKVLEEQGKVKKDVKKMRAHMKEMRAHSYKLESMLQALLQSQNVKWEEEDYQEEGNEPSQD